MGELGSGRRIGRYVILEELGEGGHGVVYRAHDEEGGRDVALKILRLSSPTAVRRMRREARATAGLDPVRIAQVYEIGQTSEGQMFLAMEYVPGRTLRELLRGGAVIERGEALRVLGEIATTLGEAHRAGIVHRDVKPENVIVRGDGRVVLLDFGIAKQIEATGDAAAATTQLTSDGALIGTPAYLAPEQALGKEVGPGVDQFALAVTAFELLTGTLPWTATEVTRVLAQLLAETPPAASTLNETLPESYDAVLWRALSKRPGERFSSVEEFVAALRGAERGNVVAPSAGQTLEEPVPLDAPETRAVSPASPPTHSWPRVALGAFVVLGALGGGGALIRARRGSSPEPPRAARATPALVISQDSPLACPIFEVAGVAELDTWIGAAASTLACGRAKWFLGGRDDRVLPPAALLDAPVQPTADIPKLYDVPGQRGRTLEVAKKRGLPYLDGRVARERDSWRLDLFVRAPDGTEIARATGIEASQLLRAVKSGMTRLWQPGSLAPARIDPEVATWTALPDIEAGLTELDLVDQAVDPGEACATIERRAGALGSAFYRLHANCDGPGLDAGPPALDESSPPALVASLMAALFAGSPPPVEELRRLAGKLEELRAAEPSRFGRAKLADATGTLWSVLLEKDRAQTLFLAALVDDPLLFDAWTFVAGPESRLASSTAARSFAASWFPYDPAFLTHSSSGLSDELDARLHDARLAYLLFPNLTRVLYLGRALAEAGQEDEVRALTAIAPAGLASPDPVQAPMLLAFVDLHDGRFSLALQRFESAGLFGLYQTSILAEILGRRTLESAKWAQEMLAMGDAQARSVTAATASIALCMNAGRGLASRCLERVDALSANDNLWGSDGGALLQGAKRYAVADLRGAVDAWRPLVGTSSDDVARLLPTEAFERVGERGLAARVDARKLKYRYFAGVSDATPREARRALEQGDRARARELAQKVVTAWEVADATVPAVAEMRALLAKTSRP